jgi:hypothetical protein
MFDLLRAEVDRIVGRPYRDGACGPASFNCLGVLFWLYRRVGVNLDDRVALGELGDPRARCDLLRLRDRFAELAQGDAIAPGDVIVREAAAVPPDAAELGHRWLPRDPELAIVETPATVVTAVHGGRVVRLPAAGFLGAGSRIYRLRGRE